MSLSKYEPTLNAAGWYVDKLADGTVGQMLLPCGNVVWIDGVYQGVQRTGYLCIDSGVVMLHGDDESNDCHVDAFVRRAAMVPDVVVEKPVTGKQRSLF